MPRSVTFGLVLTVLASACALVEPPVEAGTFVVLGEVRNMTPHPVEFEARTPAGVTPGAVQPASLPAGPSTSNVTYQLPLAGEWRVAVNGDPFFVSSPDFPEIQQGCTLESRSQPTGRRQSHATSIRRKPSKSLRVAKMTQEFEALRSIGEMAVPRTHELSDNDRRHARRDDPAGQGQIGRRL